MVTVTTDPPAPKVAKVTIECSLVMAAAIRGFLGGGYILMKKHIHGNGSDERFFQFVDKAGFEGGEGNQLSFEIEDAITPYLDA